MGFDLYENQIDKNKFQYTNLIWNELKLNSPWSIGYVSRLINNEKFRTKEEWKEYYFKSGQDRIDELNKLSKEGRAPFFYLDSMNEVDNHLKGLNLNYGRTKESLRFKGKILFDEIVRRGNLIDITEEECIYAVMFRVIGETWNGIMGREIYTIKSIKNYFKTKSVEIEIINTNGMFDNKYAVDCEIYCNGFIICGLQIKPLSYLIMDGKYDGTRELNIEKNKKYENTFNRPVYYIYSTDRGVIKKTNLFEIVTYVKSSMYNVIKGE